MLATEIRVFKIAKEAASNTSNRVNKVHRVIVSNLQTSEKRQRKERRRKWTINLGLGWNRRRQYPGNNAGLQLLRFISGSPVRWGIPKPPALGVEILGSNGSNAFIYWFTWVCFLCAESWIHGPSDAGQGFFYGATASGQGDWELSWFPPSPQIDQRKFTVTESTANPGFVGSYEASLRVNSQRENSITLGEATATWERATVGYGLSWLPLWFM